MKGRRTGSRSRSTTPTHAGPEIASGAHDGRSENPGALTRSRASYRREPRGDRSPTRGTRSEFRITPHPDSPFAPAERTILSLLVHGYLSRRGCEFLAALLAPAPDRVGIASGIWDSDTVNWMVQFLNDPLTSANRSSYFDSVAQFCPRSASLACRCAQSPRHDQVMSNCKQ